MDDFQRWLDAAIDQAIIGRDSGGVPIGSVLVLEGEIIGAGHNQRLQKGSPILHAEMDAIESAGRLSVADYRRSILVSTLSPCDMCAGASLLYQIPTIIIGENQTFRGPEEYLESRGVALHLVDDRRCRDLMERFIQSHPTVWNEDIGK